MKTWKPINHSELKAYFVISTDGEIQRVKNNSRDYTGRSIRGTIDMHGYRTVHLRTPTTNKTYKLHRLLMLTFKPESHFEGAVVNHINTIKHDCRLENMEWTTVLGNTRHASNAGLLKGINAGSKSGQAKLTESQVKDIRRMRNEGRKLTDIANLFDIGFQNVSLICQGKTWGHI